MAQLKLVTCKNLVWVFKTPRKHCQLYFSVFEVLLYYEITLGPLLRYKTTKVAESIPLFLDILRGNVKPQQGDTTHHQSFCTIQIK